MTDYWKSVLVCALFLIISEVRCDDNNVPLILVDGAAQKGAVCMDGSPAAYHYAPGSGVGANSWIVYLMGGGWCGTFCRDRFTGGPQEFLGTTKNVTAGQFTGILSSNQSINPDFYNWNRVFVRYCDGACFLGDNQVYDMKVKNNIQLRGSKIFDAVMEQLLANGMQNADNAILMGASAGGLATMFHCDGFHGLLPNAKRVKCISDSGFFTQAKEISGANFRQGEYDDVVEVHNLTSFLPQSCVSKVSNPGSCLFGENLVGDIQTPFFILNSAFDLFEISWALRLDDNSYVPGWSNCTSNPTVATCTPTQLQLIKDFRNAYLEALKGLSANPSRGMFINSYYRHIFSVDNLGWTFEQSLNSEKKSIAQAIGDWYFDRSYEQLIDTQAELPLTFPTS